MQNQKEEKQNIDGFELAKLYKYYAQDNKSLKFKLSFQNIKAKSLYSSNKLIFDKLSVFCKKHHIDARNYIYYFVSFQKNCENSASKLLSADSILNYIDWLKSNKLNKDIYHDVLDSMKFIAEHSISLGYLSSKDFIRHIISHKLISQYFISGKISIYYFAAIPAFKNIILKLDQFAKCDFKHLHDNFELYNARVVNAFLKVKNIKINPIDMTDGFIIKLKNLKK